MKNVYPALEVLKNYFNFFFFFWSHCTVCGILVPQSGIEPLPPALEAWSLNHWTVRKVPILELYDMNFSSENTNYTVLVALSCPTLVPLDPPGSSVHGDSPGKNTGVGCHFLL